MNLIDNVAGLTTLMIPVVVSVVHITLGIKVPRTARTYAWK